MSTPTDKRFVFQKTVLAVTGVILLGIGIIGLASLPSTIRNAIFPNIGGSMMGPEKMMSMMGGDSIISGFANSIGPFGMNLTTSINTYITTMLAIYIGLIAGGGYLVFRAARFPKSTSPPSPATSTAA